jgi:hypothetical protein
MENSSHGSQHGASLLAHGGEVATNDTKGRGSLRTAKGARNLLLDFDHSQIALRQVVGPSRQLHRLHL